MTEYLCPYCQQDQGTWTAARNHVAACPEVASRISALGWDLESAVRSGKIKLEDAEAEQATRPKLNL